MCLLETGTVTAVVQLYRQTACGAGRQQQQRPAGGLPNCSRRSSLQAVGMEKIVIRKLIIIMDMKAYPCLTSLALF